MNFFFDFPHLSYLIYTVTQTANKHSEAQVARVTMYRPTAWVWTTVVATPTASAQALMKA